MQSATHQHGSELLTVDMNMKGTVTMKPKSKASLPCHLELRHKESKPRRVTPSFYAQEMMQSTEERLANINVIHPPRILELFETCLVTHAKSFVAPDQACFLPYPSEIIFQNYCPSQTYQFPLLLFNNDKVSRHVKLQHHDSEQFVVVSPEDARIKVAPGLSVTFTVFFTPRENKDYHDQLIFTTEREKFEVPIRAIGPRAILDFRDELHLPVCPVKATTQRTHLVRNIGNSRAMFKLKTERPFSVSPTSGTLDVGESMQVSVDFTPMNPGDHRHDMVLHYHTGEDVFISLYGTCEELNIHLQPDSALLEKTYISLCTTYKVSLHNSSNIPLRYQWTTWASQQEEDLARDLVLLSEAKSEQLLQSLPMTVPGLPLSSATIESRSHHVNDHLLALSHRCICMEPAEGDIWPNTTAVFNIVFKPDEAKLYQRTIYCDITGKESRIPLTIKGQGLGPRLELNYHFMDMKTVFQNDNDSYEVMLSNKGLIDAAFQMLSPNTTFGRCFSFSPEEGVVIPGACQIVQVTFRSSVLGTFSEDLLLTVKGQPEQRTLTFRGCVIGPTFHFNVSALNFGDVAFGFPQTAICTLFNTSFVPMTFALRVLGDGMGSPSINSAKQLSDLCRNNWQGNSSRDCYASPVEFTVSPAGGTIRAMSDIPIKVTLCSNTVKKYRLALAVDVDGVGEEVMALPINARCVVPEIMVEPPVLDMQRCFLNHPYKKQVRLINSSPLPACYGVLDQDYEADPSLIVGSSRPRGLIGPHSFEDLPVLMLVKAVGRLEHTLHIAIFGSLHPPLEVKFICIGQGPLLHIQSRQLDFGKIPVLTDVTRTLQLFNQSPIPARFTVELTHGSKSMWRVEPSRGEVSPEGHLELQVVAHLKDTVPFQDRLELSIHDSQTHMVLLSAAGTGTTIISDRPFCPSLDLGTHFSHGPCQYHFTLTNLGQRAHLMYWKADLQPQATRSQDCSSSSGRSFLSSVSSRGKKKELSGSMFTNTADKPVFSISPSRLELFPGCSIEMVLSGSSGVPKVVQERLYCQGIVGHQGNIENIMTVDVRCRFVAPVLSVSATLLKFYTEKVPGKDLVPLYEILLLQNVSSLPLSMELSLAAPFSLCESSGAISSTTTKSMVLDIGKQAEVWVCFDPSFCQNRISQIVDKCLNIRYEGHPKQDTVDLHGEVHYPNLHVSCTSVDFGCVLNCTENHREVTITNCSPLPVLYRWAFLVKTRSPPRLTEEQPVSDPSATQTSMCLEEVFDVVPIHGHLQPGAQQLVTFSFYGRDNICREVVAQCRVEEGPNYEVELKGEAAEISYRLDQTLIDFGLQRFDDAAEALLTLTNTGKVGFDFHFERPETDAVDELLLPNAPEMTDSSLELIPGRPLVLPSVGRVYPGKQQCLRIVFLPGVPDTFEKRLHLVVGHLPPQDVTVTGEGVFARISLNLPRTFPETMDQVLLQARAAVEADRVQLEQDGTGTHGAATWTSGVFTYEELLHLEVERLLIKENAVAVTKSLLAQSHAQGSVRKWNKLSRFLLPEYALEFGYVIPGQVVSNTLNITNPGPVAVSFQVSGKSLLGTGFSVEFDRVKNLPCGEIQTLTIRFDPQGSNLPRGEVSVLLPIQTSGGPVVQVRLAAVVTVPTVTSSTDTMLFDTVQCGMCEIRTVQLINDEPVPCSWTLAEVVKPTKKVGKFLPLHLHKKYYQENRPPPVVFEATPSSGLLSSGERVNVQIKFSPNDEGEFDRQLVVHMVDNPQPFFISVKGRAEMPQLEFCPAELNLWPSLPLSMDVEAEVKVKNPCSFPIEFYSLDFDTQFLEEEKILRMMKGYDEHNKLLLPPRVPGKSLPPELLDFYNDHCSRLHDAAEAGEGFEGVEAPRGEPLQDDRPRRQSDASPSDGIHRTSEQTEIFFSEVIHEGSSDRLGQLEMTPVSRAIARHMGIDLSPEGLAARNRKGVSIIVHGAPQTDKDGMAAALAQYYGAACLTLDAVVKDALLNGTSPVSLMARQHCEKASAKYFQKKGITSVQSSRTALTDAPPNAAHPVPHTAPHPAPPPAPHPAPHTAPHPAPQPTPHPTPAPHPDSEPQSDSHAEPSAAPSCSLPDIAPKSKPVKHIRSDSKALLESESRAMAACLKVDVSSLISLFPEQLLVDVLAERLQMSDCHRGVVINGLESIYVQPVTNTLQIVLKALNNRKHIYLVNMTDCYAAVKGREKAKVKAEEAAEKAKAEEEEQWLHEMDEEEYEALSVEDRERVDQQRKDQKLRELERIAQQQQEKKLLEEMRKRQREEMMKKKSKRSGKKESKDLSRMKNSLDPKQSGSPLRQTSSETSKDSPTDSRGQQEEEGDVDDKVPSPNQGEGNLEEKQAEPQEVEPEKEVPRHDEVQARFKVYEQSQSRVAHILQYWDRALGVLLVAVPTDDATPLPDGPESKPTPVTKRPKKTRVHSPLLSQSPAHVSVPHITIKVKGKIHPSVPEILKGHMLPSLDEVLDDLGIGPKGPPIPPPVKFAIVPYPEHHERAMTDQACENFQFLSPSAAEGGLTEEMRDMLEEEEPLSLGKTSAKGNVKEATATKEKDKGDRNSQKSRRRPSAKQKTKGAEQSPSDPSQQDQFQASLEAKRSQRLRVFRWVVPAHGEVLLKIWFFSEFTGTFQRVFNFKLLGIQRKYQLLCTGQSTFPSICKSYKTLFPYSRHVPRKEPGLKKTYVVKPGFFEFGPLLCSKNRDRYKENKHPDNAERLVIHNNSGMEAEVRFRFQVDTQAATYILEPACMILEPDQKQELSIWAYPTKVGQIQDCLLCCVKDNPEMVSVPLSCWGVRPELELEGKHLQFDRILLNRWDTRSLNVHNRTALPAFWRLQGLEELGDGFSAPQDHGIVPPFSTHALTLRFRACKLLQVKKIIRLEVSDVENIFGITHTENIHVTAEAYDVALDVIPDGHLDFGTIKVFEAAEQCLKLKNQGKYEFAYRFVLVCTDASQPDPETIFTVTPKSGTLAPHKKPSAFEIVCKPESEVTFVQQPILRCQVIEPNSPPESEVIGSLDIMISVQSVFSRCIITPASDIGFGPVIYGSKKSQSFIIENKGCFETRYNMAWNSEDVVQSKCPNRRRHREAQARMPGFANKARADSSGYTQRISMGVFSVFPSSGSLQPGSHQVVMVECVAEQLGKCSQEMLIDISDRDPSDHPEGIPYTLLAEICKPGIVMDLASIFEEHNLCQNSSQLSFEHICNEEGTYIVDESKFVFARVLVGRSGQARFKITNDTKVPCTLGLAINYFGIKLSTNVEVFTMPLTTMTVASQSHSFIVITFTPQAMNQYSAVFEACFLEGSTRLTPKVLEFELVGEGCLPSVCVVRPLLKNSEGNPMLQFRRVLARRRQSLPVVLLNDGNVRAQLTVDMLDRFGVFALRAISSEVSCTFTTTPIEGATDSELQLVHRAVLSLEVNQQVELEVSVCSEKVLMYSSRICVQVEHNYYCNTVIEVVGEVFQEVLTIDNLSRTASEGEEEEDAEGQYEVLNFGDCHVECSYQESFTMTNHSSNQTLKFEWPAAGAQISFAPQVGHLHAGCAKEVTVTFCSAQPVTVTSQSMKCKVCEVEFEQPLEQVPDWDDQHKTVQWLEAPAQPPGAQQVKNKVIEVDPEPVCTMVPGSKLELELRVSAVCDYAKFKFGTEAVNFKDTMLYQSRIHEMQMTNQGSVRLDFSWQVHMGSSNNQGGGAATPRPPSSVGRLMAGDRPSSALASVMTLLMGNPELPPFSVEPSVGSIPPGAQQTFLVRFSPLEVTRFQGMLLCSIPNLQSEEEPPLVSISGRCLLPHCHFDLEDCGYLSQHRRNPAFNSHLDPNTRVVEFVAVGFSTPITRSFNVVNPTSRPFTFKWKAADASESLFCCLTPSGTVLPGKKLEMSFQYLAKQLDVVESCWSFTIEALSLSFPFLCVGSTREPVVYLEKPHLDFGERVIGCKVERTICLVNAEEEPLSFSVMPSTLVSDKLQDTLRLEPMSGTVGPRERLPLLVTFTPSHEGHVNFRPIIKVKKRSQPIVLPVKADCFAMSTCVQVQNPEGDLREICPDSLDTLDFGKVGISELAAFEILVSNMARCSLELSVELLGPDAQLDFLEAKPTYLHVDVGMQKSFSLIFTPRSICSLQDVTLHVKVQHGPKFTFLVKGRGEEPSLEFSFTRFSFGRCFLFQPGMTPPSTMLTICNRDKKDISIQCQFSNTLFLEVGFQPAVLSPGAVMEIPFTFYPRHVCRYHEMLTFILHSCTTRQVDILGQGFEMKLEVEEPKQKMIKLGAMIGQSVKKKAVLCNHSLLDLPLSLVLVSSSKVDLKDLSCSPMGDVTLKARGGTCNIDVSFLPRQHVPTFTAELQAEYAGLRFPLLSVQGRSQGVEVQLDVNHLPFGAVVQHCKIKKKVSLVNSGDIGAKFQWKTDLFPAELCIEPVRGYISPGKEVTFEVTFAPVKLCTDIRFENLTCVVEGFSSPLAFTVTASCIAATTNKEVVNFICPVRGTHHQQVPVTNPTNQPCTIRPVLEGGQWRAPPALMLEPNQSKTYEVTYTPLTMSLDGKRDHGTLFFSFPDGTGTLFLLLGLAEAPEPESTITRELPAKTQHHELLPVVNWLTKPQRFVVKMEVLKMDKNDTTVSLRGLDYIDVPALAKKDYKVTFHAYREGLYNTKVSFVNQESREYLFHLVTFKATATGSLATFELVSSVRKKTSASVELENPLGSASSLSVECKCHEVNVPSHYTVPERSKATMTFEYLPVRPGESSTRLTLYSSELGYFHYDLLLKALPPPPERTVHFSTSLGGSHTLQIKFINYSRFKTEYSCKTDCPEFIVDRCVGAAAGHLTGSPVSVEVCFEPYQQGEVRGQLSLSSGTGGEYTFPLHGVCRAPKAQGPYNIRSGRTINISFKNVFPQTTAFSYQVDNPLFTVKGIETILSKRSQSILVSFEAPAGDTSGPWFGKMTISSQRSDGQRKPCTWVYYLKGFRPGSP
ncbi:hydrocephalus-inducing protein homolog isoform 3-T3 [Synchiropus picturatus]